MAGKSTGKKSFFEKVKGYFKGLKAEIRKINWPTGEQVLKQTLVVVIVSAILCGFIRLIDVLSQLLIGTVSSIF
ncbi:MAG: preprotein translocase subunit SecE [Lachnospiraceae bacterium]|nr:preprotein translocase subunit SecE [Lachnospiraceae bacterium]